MKRWIISSPEIPKLKLYFETLEIAQAKYPNAEIIEDLDIEYLEYVKKIQSLKIGNSLYHKGYKEIIKIPVSNGFAYYYQGIDKNDGFIYDYCEYQIHDKSSLIQPISFTMSTPKEFYEMFLVNSEMSVEIVSKRKYGQPKLNKPKELKGLKKSFSVNFFPKKASCQCFVLKDDLYVKHSDYFSSLWQPPKGEVVGMPQNYYLEKYFNKKRAEKFVYSDNWGEIILRNECWFKIKNIKQQFNQDRSILNMRKELLEKWGDLHHIRYGELDVDWEIFFENILKEYKKAIDNI